MKVLIVSGFLGAGKTTFIRELLRCTNIRAVVLENEYGETDLDSRSVRAEGYTDVLEFMEGCVCCTRKDAFANTVLTISSGLDPDYLVVEPSGIGKLGSILNNVRRVSYGKICLLPPVLILAPRSMLSHLAEYPEIFADQVEHAGQIILTKCESEDKEMLHQALAIIRRYNQTAPILETPYRLQEDDWWFSLLGADTVISVTGNTVEGLQAKRNLHDFEHEHGHDTDPDCRHEHEHSRGHDHDHDYEQDEEAPVHITLHEGSLNSVGGLALFLEAVLRGKFGRIVRAKGTLRAGGEWLRFDVSDGLYAITGAEDEQPVTQSVFIGRDINRQAIHTVLCGNPDRNDSQINKCAEE